MYELELSLLQTVTLAAVVYYAGVLLRREVPFLNRLNIPSAVIGGLVFAILVLLLRDRVLNLRLDTAAQPLLNVAFFTSIGMGASLALLRTGGRPVLLFLALAVVVCFLQNFLGIGIAMALGEAPLLGVLAGSVTLVGGPATGQAFAPQFAAAGVDNASVLAITAAVFGIVCGGLAGSPVSTWLLARHRLRGPGGPDTSPAVIPTPDQPEPGTLRVLAVHIDREDNSLVRNLAVLGLAMGLGSLLSAGIQQAGLTLPAYIGAMVAACLLRNLDDATGWLGVDETAMELAGGIALNIFLVVALMDLRLWELTAQALSLFILLAAQLLAIVLVAAASFRLMGRDYDAAVMAGGLVGFAMGTTANAVANMRAITSRYGPAPRAFLVVPLVGAFFIDFINALVITGFLNAWR
jgi:ESS family glutamate:Na+ symporter